MVELAHYQQDQVTSSIRSAEDDQVESAAISESPPQDTLYLKCKKELRRRILHTTPSWFAINMGTGITSILLHELPYQFNGLRTIANVIFVLNIVLFFLILALSVARYTIWPTLFKTMLFHPTQSLFLGTFPMGMATIISMVVYSLVPAWGPNWSLVAWAIWWVDATLALVICIGLPFIQFTRHSQSFDNITGIWFLPVVTTVVIAATGATVATVLEDEAHVRLTVLVSYILWGTGVPFSVMLMTLYYARLAIYKIPPATLIVSVFLPLGPCGQGAFGLLQLSKVVTMLADKMGKPPFGGPGDAEVARITAIAVQAVTVPVALIMWGLGLVWLVLAVATIADMTAASIVPFNMGWWGYTFPMGVFATATTALGHLLDSTAFLVIGTVMSVLVSLLWLLLFLVTGYRAVTLMWKTIACSQPRSQAAKHKE